MLADALCELAKNKHINRITIKEIVDYCNASRQTFYNHFKDKYDLISWVYKRQAETILQTFRVNKNWNECINKIYLLFTEDKQFYYKIMKIEGQNSFSAFLYEHSCRYYQDSIVERFGTRELTEELRFTIEFNCHGAVNMCRKWILSGMSLPPEEIAGLIVDNMPDNLKKYFV